MQAFFYILLKSYCRMALRFYYRTWQVQHQAPVPDGPLLFVANHPNAFLDGVLVSCSTARNPWFLARGDVFQKAWAKKILGWLKLRPVFRFRDGFHTLRKNDEMIEGCVDLLSRNESILIFAEGDHSEPWSLLPLQKGFAKIALSAMKKNIAVHIVPVALQYDSLDTAGSRVLVSVGKPISVMDSTSLVTDTKVQMELLIDRTYESLKSMMVHIEPTEYEKTVNSFLQNRILKTDLVEQLSADQKMISAFKSLPPPSISKESPRSTKQRWFNPVFIYYVLNNALPKAIIHGIIKYKVKDPQFVGSLKFTLGMILVPLCYLIQSGAVLLLSNSLAIAGAYLISLPASLLFARIQGQASSRL